MQITMTLDDKTAKGLTEFSGLSSARDAITKLIQDYLKSQTAKWLVTESNKAEKRAEKEGWLSEEEVYDSLEIDK
jgi:rRNA processing protein Krr1/Pno1